MPVTRSGEILFIEFVFVVYDLSLPIFESSLMRCFLCLSSIVVVVGKVVKRFSHGRPMKSPDVLGSIDADVMKLNVNNVTSKKTYAEAVTHNPTVTAVESVGDVGVPFGDVSAKKCT